jgi:tetratricopeptide (TPR) repeat protein
MQLALLYAQRQDFDEAVQTLQPATDQAPNDARLYYNLANMHARRAIQGGETVSYGYADAALRAYRRAIEIDPQFLKAYYNLACVSSHIEVEDGIAAWEQYVRVASGVATEQEWLAKARGYLRRLKALEAAD